MTSKYAISAPTARYLETCHSEIEAERLQRIGACNDDNIRAQLLPQLNNEELGSHCIQYFMPEFRQQVEEASYRRRRYSIWLRLISGGSRRYTDG